MSVLICSECSEPIERTMLMSIFGRVYKEKVIYYIVHQGGCAAMLGKEKKVKHVLTTRVQ